MKATSLKTAAVFAGSISLLAGNAMAQATTGVVGYETLDNVPGFNFVGIRLHNPPVASGDLETINANDVVDADIDLGALMDGSTFILEIENGDGVIQEVTASDGGTGLATADTSGIAAPANYTLRAADTMESIFGSSFTGSGDFGVTNGTLDSGLTIGYGSTGGADQVWFWNGTGFTEYYFDEFTPASSFASAGWVNLDNTAVAVTAADIDMVYPDGFIISSASGNDLVVTGDLKATNTELGLVSGFNFVSSVAPVGATLETAYGSTFTGSGDFGVTNGTLDSGLAIGYGSTGGADQVWIWNGAGFTEYYFDEFTPASSFASAGWVNLDNTAVAVTASSVSMPSGYIVSAAAPRTAVQGVPAFYAGL